VASFDLAKTEAMASGQASAEHPLKHAQFYLAYGKIHLDDGRAVPFHKVDLDGQPVSVPELAKAIGVQEATVKLEGPAPGSVKREWRLLVETRSTDVRPAKTEPTVNPIAAADRQVLDRHVKELQTVVKKLLEFPTKVTTKDLIQCDEAANVLVERLRIPGFGQINAPKRPGTVEMRYWKGTGEQGPNPRDEFQSKTLPEYLQKVQHILETARKELANRSGPPATTAAGTTASRGAAGVERLHSISAVLYRLVGDVRDAAVVIGEPR
jgi:hypothetical protein